MNNNGSTVCRPRAIEQACRQAMMLPVLPVLILEWSRVGVRRQPDGWRVTRDARFPTAIHAHY